MSESLAEDNHEGIAVEQEPLVLSEGAETETISGSNTFTDDVSRNNDWDFVVETDDTGGPAPIYATSVSPVTNLSIGASTAPDTTLSFDAEDVRLRSLDTPEPNPESENISRYFEAEELSADAFLDVSLRYEDGDVEGVNESALEFQRFVGTQWVTVPGSSVDTENNTLSLNATGFGASDFGAFGEAQDSDDLFTEPLPGFNNPPTNTGELDPNLYEDISGDSNGTDPSQTVTLWTQLVINEDAFDDLTQQQIDALDWDGDGQLTPSDAVDLWTQQVLAS